MEKVTAVCNHAAKVETALIINADGFGFTPGVNRGIRESILQGVVTSTSCVVNFPSIEEIAELSELPHISIGIHFNLSVGKPLAPAIKIPTLLNGKGEFWRELLNKQLMLGRIKKEHIVTELEAQVERLLGLGIRPSHWDGHQHKHLHPLFFVCAAQVAKKYGITHLRSHKRYILLEGPASTRFRRLTSYYATHPHRFLIHTASRFLTRIGEGYGFKTADRLISFGYLGRQRLSDKGTWRAILNSLPPGINEFYCHPAYPDETLRQYALYVDERLQEKDILISEDIRDLIRKNNIKLLSFRDF
jgi:predicted glycoside hydrolase/deacetylase ChbG (UPF0249 family)